MTNDEKNYVRLSHLKFIRHFWSKPDEKYEVGRHTRTICHLIDTAFEDFRQGKSTFLVVKVHPRAGKSEILSQNGAAHFLGEFPDKDVMICCYNSTLAEKNARYARGIVESEKYSEIYPNSEISGGIKMWGLEGRKGMVTASGLTSGITGNGYSFGILDDYLSGRAEAESEVIRNKIWEEFANSFITRRAPVSITIILATQWHKDDVIGRLEESLDPSSDRYNPKMPKFKFVSFPAKNGEGDVWVAPKIVDGVVEKGHWERQEWEYLFTERFSPEYYEQQRAVLGEYGWSSLYQCDPQTRGGNLLKVESVKVHDDVSDFPKTKYWRVWDLAHTARQTQSSDPDWTSGTLLAYVQKSGTGAGKDNPAVWELWIKDVARFRDDTPERDRLVRAVSDKDGVGVGIAVEQSLDATDAVKLLRQILLGIRTVSGLNLRKYGDKVARISYVEPIFEAGNVHILRGDWNYDWIKEMKEFPSGRHDDQVDNISAGYALMCDGKKNKVISGGVAGV